MSINISDISPGSKYDIAVIGAGIAGVSAAWFLRKRGMKVLLMDRSAAAASGGSGAAGAFVAPKIGRGSPLLQLTNRAFSFSRRFYRENFPESFHQTGLLRIPKDEKDEERFPLYEPFNCKPYEKWDASRARGAGYHDIPGGFFFPEAGDCDAQSICRSMAEGVEFLQMEAEEISYVVDGWRVAGKKGRFTVPRIVLATGYRSELLDMRYMGIRGLWGSRGNYASALSLDVSAHRDFTISTNRGGIIKLGATHIKDPQPCLVCNGRPLESLETKAAKLADTGDLRLVETMCGMRSTSRDHFPLAGPVIDAAEMLRRYPALKKGAKVPLIHHKNIYILNGMGGRGFVFAPFVAKLLTDYIVDGVPLEKDINPDRLFFKWARRLV
jgi:tRNA 5-methylaminomethyl-2-thiouridine biosynthesis bifunctional protein